ncbi:Brain protein I3 [Pseudolycoriella hygida]|uniref:Membrane protein BRI3 n=1 Tax=Pseudolycoriella hygida TaxID=35572 RepID=A0A9Q0S5I4_9DIPT|nr:Brain protein I3 [Pseudolycoriella hygida]
MKDGNYSDQPPPYSQIGGIDSSYFDVTHNIFCVLLKVSVYPDPNHPNVPNVPIVGNPQYVGGISQQTFATPVYPYPTQQTFITTQPIATAPPMYGATESTIVNIPTEILVIGGCPACRIGVLQDDYSCLGVCCAIVFFPIGILCCLAMKTKRCSNCGMEY